MPSQGAGRPAKALLAAAALGASLAAAGGAQAARWVVYYGSEASYERFTGYDLVVLDPSDPPAVQPLRARGVKVYGYLSIGEVEDYRPHFDWAKKRGLLLEENENWEGNYVVDVRQPAWHDKLIYDVVPRLRRQGFQGLMLDTADSPLAVERTGGAEYAGMADALVRLIRSLDRNFPHMGLILNRGYPILDRVAKNLDYALGESVYTTYNFDKDKAVRLPEKAHRRQVRILKNAREINPDLTVLTLDYWDPSDTATVKEIYRTQRSYGFWPYVATVDLQQVVPEPE